MSRSTKPHQGVTRAVTDLSPSKARSVVVDLVTQRDETKGSEKK